MGHSQTSVMSLRYLAYDQTPASVWTLRGCRELEKIAKKATHGLDNIRERLFHLTEEKPPVIADNSCRDCWL
jgi:hypothetical protein